MSILSAIRKKVIGIVKDDAKKLDNPHDYDRIINASISEYSRHRPDTKVVDITGDGGHDYDQPSGWVDGFSSIESIEFPTGDVPATYLDEDSYTIYNTPTGKKLRLIDDTPEATEDFRVTFTIPRAATTIPDNDVDAVSNLSSSLCCEELANAYANSSDSTIGADAVNHRSKSQEYASRAKRLEALYNKHLGLKDKDTTPAASATTDLDIGYPGGGDRLTHPRKRREQR